MEKEGIGHIEVILSFVLFIGFVFMGLYFFSPSNSSRLVDSSLAYASSEIIENTSVDVQIYTVIINQSNILNRGGNQGNDQTPRNLNRIAINLNSIRMGMKVRVENYSGYPFRAKVEDNSVIVDIKISNNPYPDLLYVKLSEDMNETPLEANPTADNPYSNEEYYTVSSSTSRKMVSEERIEKLNETYYSDYLNLKKEFNLPSRADFGFNLKLSEDKSIESENSLTAGMDIFSDIKRVEVLRSDGSIKFADLMVKVW